MAYPFAYERGLCQRVRVASVSMPEVPELRALLGRAADDSGVQAVILTGSWARGMNTARSDVDAYVVVQESDGWLPTRSKTIDVAVCTLADLQSVPEDPRQWGQRYAFVDAKVLFERTEGTVGPLAMAWANLTTAEVERCLATYLDGYLNFLYRSLKADRDGALVERRLDGVESISWMLWVVFALFGRVRPYNKYLEYELRHRPLWVPGWDGLDLIGNLSRVMDTGDAAAQREIYRLVEPAARRLGHGQTIDAWGDDLVLLRGE